VRHDDLLSDLTVLRDDAIKHARLVCTSRP
jgi:hypothetical protein